MSDVQLQINDYICERASEPINITSAYKTAMISSLALDWQVDVHY